MAEIHKYLSLHYRRNTVIHYAKVNKGRFECSGIKRLWTGLQTLPIVIPLTSRSEFFEGMSIIEQKQGEKKINL